MLFNSVVINKEVRALLIGYLLVGIVISFVVSAVIWAVCVMAGVTIGFREIFSVVIWVVEVLVVVDYIRVTIRNAADDYRSTQERNEIPARAQHDWDRPNEESDYTEIGEIDRGRSISDCAICGASDADGLTLGIKMHTARAASRLASRLGNGAGILQPTPGQHVVRIGVCFDHKGFLDYLRREMVDRVRYPVLDEHLEGLRAP